MPKRDARASYRLCWINEAGSIDAVTEPFRAPCDADAIRRASAMADGDRFEPWPGTRFLAELAATTLPQTLH